MCLPVISISEGEIRGCSGTDSDGGQFFSFLGIPFAKAPVGELRFKAPQPIEAWDGVRDCTRDGNCSLQKDTFITKDIVGSEDCLFLNVFTKKLPQEDSTLKPVMVFIHGGGFIMGSNNTKFHGPEYIITKDVVLVSINYRLGFFGFLALEDPSLEVPGNAGMKDQVFALKWVQRNIKFFNGDPNNVTIFGQSAGAAAVHYHILSPSAKGLFHKAILQSGSVLNPWAGSNLNVLDFMDFIGRDVEDEKAAFKILMELPADELCDLQDKYLNTKPPIEVFGPVVEKSNPTAFLTRRPIEIMTSGEYNQVPILMGYTSNEGLMIAAFVCEKTEAGELKRELILENFIHPDMKLGKGCPASNLICEKMAEYYYRKENMKNPYMLLSDYFFVVGIIGSAKIHSKTSHQPVYLYKMSLETNLNIMKTFFQLSDLPGVCHADDVGYLFKSAYVSGVVEYGELELIGIQRFLKLWTNFAKYGNPTPEENEMNIHWKPVEEKNIHFLEIDRELTMQADPEAESIDLWKDIFRLSPSTAEYL